MWSPCKQIYYIHIKIVLWYQEIQTFQVCNGEQQQKLPINTMREENKQRNKQQTQILKKKKETS